MTSVPSLVPIMSPIPLHSMDILYLLLLSLKLAELQKRGENNTSDR